MKTNNSTPQLFGFSSKPVAGILRAFYFTGLPVAFFLFISLASFASPLTGTESLRSNLYLLNSNNTTILADGVLTEYSNSYHDSVTLEDAYKFTNINENLGLTRYGSVLAVERRPIILVTDTIFLKLWRTTCRNYQFEFITANLDHPGMQAILEDLYLGTSTLLNLSGTTKINFSVNTDVKSSDVSRFRIVYRTNSPYSTLPVTFTYVRGYQLNNKVSIDWKVENELNIDKYEIERSANGTDFTKINSISVVGFNNAQNSYSWVDDNPFAGKNFYRVKSVDKDGSKKYSLIIKVITGKAGLGSITIYPNPIKDNMVNLQFTDQPSGVYQLRLISNNGQLVYMGNLSINSRNISQTIYTKKLIPGMYQLEIKAPDNTVNIQKAIVQE